MNRISWVAPHLSPSPGREPGDLLHVTASTRREAALSHQRVDRGVEAALEVWRRAGSFEALVERVLGGDEPLAAPHLLDLEIARVLRRYVAGREIDAARAEDALADYRAMQVACYPHDALLDRVWELRANCTAYDASFIALAEALRCPLVTCDAALAKIPGHVATIEVFT